MSVVNDFLEELRKVIEVRGRGYQAEIARAMGLNEPTFSNMVSGEMGQRNRGADSIRITAPRRGGARGCTLSGGARQIHHGGRAREKSKHEKA